MNQNCFFYFLSSSSPFFSSYFLLTFCLTYYKTYESMTGPIVQRVLSYLLTQQGDQSKTNVVPHSVGEHHMFLHERATDGTRDRVFSCVMDAVEVRAPLIFLVEE